jgi:hypothetical protein
MRPLSASERNDLQNGFPADGLVHWRRATERFPVHATGTLEHFRFLCLLSKWTDMLSHPFHKLREMDGARNFVNT